MARERRHQRRKLKQHARELVGALLREQRSTKARPALDRELRRQASVVEGFLGGRVERCPNILGKGVRRGVMQGEQMKGLYRERKVGQSALGPELRIAGRG